MFCPPQLLQFDVDFWVDTFRYCFNIDHVFNLFCWPWGLFFILTLTFLFSIQVCRSEVEKPAAEWSAEWEGGRTRGCQEKVHRNQKWISRLRQTTSRGRTASHHRSHWSCPLLQNDWLGESRKQRVIDHCKLAHDGTPNRWTVDCSSSRRWPCNSAVMRVCRNAVIA